LVAALPCAAQEADGDRAVARGHEGLAAFQRGEWLVSYGLFAEANSLSPSPVFVLYMGRSLRKAGKLLHARARLRAVASEPLADGAPASWQQAQGDARTELADVDQAIPSIAIEVRGAPPGAATVLVDGAPVSVGSALELDPGSHLVVVRSQARQVGKTVALEEGMKAVPVVLDLPPPPPPPPPPEGGPGPARVQAQGGGRIAVELDASAALSPSFGGVTEDGDSVAAGALAMLHGGYQLRSGAYVGLAVGGLFMSQSRSGRPYSVVPAGQLPDEGKLDHEVSLRGALVGATVGLHVGERVPWMLRLGVGGAFTSVTDRRTGTFEPSGGGEPYSSGTLEHASGASFLFASPEARLGLRFAERFEASVGVSALVLLALGRAHWEDDQLFNAGTNAAGANAAARFDDEELTGGTIVVLTPGIGMRYDF
jgi:hypothetical protein